MPYSAKPSGHDTKCPDGFTCYGWRKVHKGGYVRFSHGRHYHEDLAEFVGLWVYVTLHDMWGINVEVWIDSPWQGVPLACKNEQEAK